jgi:hypothetical protein
MKLQVTHSHPSLLVAKKTDNDVARPESDLEFFKLISYRDVRTSSMEFTSAQPIKIFLVFYMTQIIMNIRVHKSLRLVPIQINPVHAHSTYFAYVSILSSHLLLGFSSLFLQEERTAKLLFT